MTQSKWMLVGFAAACFAFASGTKAAPLLLETFDDGVANGFSTSSNYTIQPGAVSGNAYQALIPSTSSSANATSAVEVLGVAGNNFTVSTDFVVDSFTGGGTSTVNLGLGILSATSDLSSGSQYRVLYTVFSSSATTLGAITIQEGGTTIATSAQRITPVLDANYNLSVEVTYAGLNPTFTAILTQADSTPSSISVTTTDTSPTAAGNYFGYRTAVNGAGTSVTENIDYDNFTVTVPEPATASLVGLALVGLAARRRRR